MESENLKEKVEAAKKAVEGLDSELKQTAFQTILNKLLEDGRAEKRVPSKRKKSSKKSRDKSSQVNSSKAPKNKQALEICEKINRTKYPKMFKMKSSRERALYLLYFVKEDLKIDGLTPSEISTILTEKFRLKATPNAVGMALMNASSDVDRRSCIINGANAYRYHIMHPGEQTIKEKLTKLED